MLTVKQIIGAIKLQSAIEAEGGAMRDPPADEPWPCTDCGSVALPCVCFFAQSCRDCGEDWDWCECEREL
jgi:hypothetical protein